MEKKSKFEVTFLEEAQQFLDSLEEKARNKILFNINKSSISIDPELFKKLYGEIWEFRTFYNTVHYRFFAFWDKSDSSETLVVATHGRVKKSSKVDWVDLKKAIRLREKYFEEQ